ncbi:MAG: transposase [Candidatus Brocadia sp.]|nr:MAG: transposase [Candidatus Brocadia sp.]
MIAKVGRSSVIVSRRGRQILILAGIGKRLSSREICTAYLLQWRIEIVFKELKQYLHLGSCRIQEFAAYPNHILMVIKHAAFSISCTQLIRLLRQRDCLRIFSNRILT